MSHSYAQPADLPCPNCHQTFHAELWLILDAAERPDLIERLRAGELHTLTCPHCGHTAQADAPLLLFFPNSPLPLGEGPGVRLLFSPARRTTAEEDRQHARELLTRLRQSLGEAWQDEWVEGMQVVPRELLLLILSDDPESVLRQMAEKAARALEQLRQEDPEAYRQLEEAAQRVMQQIPLLQALQSFIQAETWGKSRRILEQHPELLTDEADALLEQLIQTARERNDENARQLFEQHRNLLRRCRQVGIEQAFQEQSQGKRWQQRLLETLFAFIQAETWDESRRILEQHPELLTDEADALLEQLIQAAKAQQDENAQQLFEQHRRLLRRCREVGIKQAFAEKLLPPEVLQAAQAAGLTAEQALEIAHLVAEIPPEVREALSELAATGIEINSPQDLERLLAERPDLQQKLELAAQAIGGGLSIPPEFQPDLHRAQEGEQRYLQTGDLASLNDAIAAWERILNHPDFPHADERFRLAAWNDAGGTYLRRFEATGNLNDLHTATYLWQQAIVHTPAGSPDWASRQANLGGALLRRFEALGQVADLDAAIDAYQKALAMAREGSPDWARMQANLGVALRTRFEALGQGADLDAAIDAYQKALAVARKGSPDWASMQANLGGALLRRFEALGQVADLDAAIAAYQKALAVAREGSPDWARWQANLGGALLPRFEALGQVADLDAAIDAYQQALAVFSPEAYPDYTLTAALPLGNLLMRRWNKNDREGLVSVYEKTVPAWQYLYFEALHETRKQRQLRRSQQMWANYAYGLTHIGHPKRAVETLEMGRARQLTEALRSRQAVETLQSPDLQAAWQKVRTAEGRLRQAEEQDRPKLEEELARCRQEWYALLRQHFPDYFAAPAFNQIAAVAQDAPLVYLLATPAGGLALIVRGNNVHPVNLPALTEQALREQANAYLRAYFRWRRNLYDESARADWFTALEQILAWLGETVMAPLIEALQAIGHPQGALVRLIPGGLLGLLPLHAARLPSPSGREVGGEGYALDHYTFTYAPSAQALYHAREAAERNKADSLLAVDNPDGSLLFSALEIQAARNAFSTQPIHHLPSRRATREAVKKAANRYGVLHFSTHGQAGWGEAQAAHIRLADGELTLAEIYDLRLDRPRLAILSACETGVPDIKLIEEVESLPSGLMQAGVPGVIGSLWAVNDQSTAELMTLFYHFWQGEGQEAPYALRQAQIWLRDLFHDAQKTTTLETLSVRLTADEADRLYKLAQLRDFSHPYHWAAFAYTGL